MRARDFLDQLRHEAIVSAIGEAEKATSGEIRVFVSRNDVADPVPVAQEQFLKMGMHQTHLGNGVLIFVAPRTHKFAVIGDAGVHARCGDVFWRELTEEMSGHFRKGDFTAGLVHGIRKAGQLLAQHFPIAADDRNELSNDIEHD